MSNFQISPPQLLTTSYFENKTITINQALVKERIFSEDGRKITGRKNKIGVVKTMTSNRVILMADNLCSILQRYKLIQRSFIRESAWDKDIPNLVFVSVTVTYWDQFKCKQMYIQKLHKSYWITHL